MVLSLLQDGGRLLLFAPMIAERKRREEVSTQRE